MAEILGFANNPAGTTPLAFAVPAGTRALVILTGTNLNFFADYDDLLVDGAPIAPLEVDVGGTPMTAVEVPTGELVNQPARAYFVANPPTGTIEIIPDPDTTSFINVWAIGGERDVEVVDVRGLVSASIANPSVTMQPGGRADTVLCEIAFSGQDTVSAFGPIDGNWTQHIEIDVGAQGVGVYSRVVADGSATPAGLSQTANDALIICVAVAEILPEPELTPGTATLGTVNPYLVKASATAATGGEGTVTQQWQRSPRGAGTWTDLTGQTALTLTDRTVVAGTQYDYRLAYSDDNGTEYSNILQPNVPAAFVSWGVLGDSNSDEYRAESNIGGGTAYAATTLNWVELLADDLGQASPALNNRGLDFGAWSNTSRGEPRRRGFEYNWARFNALMSSVSGVQLTGVASQVSAGTVTHVAVQGTVNELLNISTPWLSEAYSSPDGVVGGVTGTPLATYVAQYVGHFQVVFDALVAAGAAGIVVLLPPDYMEYPDFYDGLTEPGIGYAQAFIADIWDGIIALADAVNVAEGAPVIKCVRWDEDFAPIWATRVGDYCTIGGVQINVMVASPDGSPYYRSISGHTGTVFQGVVANSFISAANQLVGVSIQPFSDAEILENAGITEVSTFMLQSSRHTHQSETASLDVGYTLSPQGSRHANQSDSVALQQVYALVLSQSRHSHEVDAVALLQANTIGITDSHHAHTVGNVGLQQAHVIGVAGSRHGHTAEAAALVQAYTVGIHNAIHGQFAGRPSLLQSYVLALSEALHEHIAKTVSLTVAGTLSPSDTSHAVVTENIGLTQAHVLPVLSATHTHTAGVSSFIQHYVTSFANARHGHVAGRIALEAFYGFGLQSSRHTHSVQNVQLTQAHVLFILDALHEHYAGTTLLRSDAWIPAELETLRMEIQRIAVMDVSFTVAVERAMAIVQRITRRFGF